MRRLTAFGRLLLVAPIVAATGGCLSSSTGSGGTDASSTFGNMFAFGQATAPPVQTGGPLPAQECPAVSVAPGRSAIRNGEGESLRSQIAISNVARECLENPDGSITVKVGVEGRALLGPAGGGGGRFDVPVSFAIKRGDAVVAARGARASVAIPPGEGGANFVVVEGGMVVPKGTGEFDIEVGLGGSGAATGRRRRAAR